MSIFIEICEKTMSRILIVLSKGEHLHKSQVAAYTKSDGTFVPAHTDNRPAASAVDHPKGHKVGAHVFFPHPQKAGKNALGRYKGQRDGKSVIEHSTGEHEVDNDHVKTPRGVPKKANAEADAKGQQEHWAKVEAEKNK